MEQHRRLGSRTVICQSHAPRPQPAFVLRCLDSVRDFAASQGAHHLLCHDELFEPIPHAIRQGLAARPVMLSDIGRLLWIKALLADYETVVWLDADVYVFAPDTLRLDTTAGAFCFGREVWVAPAGDGGLKAHTNVHNALCLFTRQNPMLAFYLHAALNIAAQCAGRGPNQLLGPKLLTSLHNTVALPLQAAVGALSPLTQRDVVAGGGPALDLFRERSAPLAAANLCSSMYDTTVDDVRLDDAHFETLMRRLDAGDVQPGGS